MVFSTIRFLRRFNRASARSIAAAVISLGVASGVGTGLFAFVDAVLLSPFPYPESNRLALVWGSQSRNLPRALSLPNLQDIGSQVTAFSGFSSYMPVGEVRLESEHMVRAVYVGREFFSILGATPLYGNVETLASTERSRPLLVLSYQLWKQRYASDRDILGKAVIVGETAYVVTAVMPPEFFFPDLSSRIWLSPPSDTRGSRTDQAALGIARLNASETFRTAQAELNVVGQRLREQYPEANRHLDVGLFALRGVVLGDYDAAFILLLAGVALLWLMSCGNAAHILLTNHDRRQVEAVTRAALGASPAHLATRVLAEGMAIALVSFGLGLGLAFLVVEMCQAIGIADVYRASLATLSWRVVGASALVVLVATVVASLKPITRTMQLDLAGALRSEGAVGQIASKPAAWWLISVEAAFSLVLVACAGSIVNGFVQMARIDWGFVETDAKMFELDVPPSYSTLVAYTDLGEAVLESVRKIEGVEAVAISSSVPGKTTSWFPRAIAVAGGGEVASAGIVPVFPVTTGYFDTLGVPIVDGRSFSQSDSRLAPNAIVLSRSLRTLVCPRQDCLGMQFEILELAHSQPEVVRRFRTNPGEVVKDRSAWENVGGSPWSVIGVVEDVRILGLEIATPHVAYIDHRQHFQWTTYPPLPRMKLVVRASASTPDVSRQVLGRVRSVEPSLRLVEAASLEDIMARSIAGIGTRRLLFAISVIMASASLIVAAIGVFGVMSLHVAHRRREFAVRLTLGANTRQIIWAVLARHMAWLGFGLFVGLFIVWQAAEVATSLLFEVDPMDPLTLVLSALLLLLVGASALLGPALRAARFNPSVLWRS